MVQNLARTHKVCFWLQTWFPKEPLGKKVQFVHTEEAEDGVEEGCRRMGVTCGLKVDGDQVILWATRLALQLLLSESSHFFTKC